MSIAGHAGMPPARILDLGCGHGEDLLNIARALAPRPTELYGIEAYPPNQEDARRRGIAIADLNLENTVYPYDDASFDCIIANQIIEHTKEIFWIFGECSRILKPNGIMIVGVPNLASFHNRMLLIFGDQPSSIELLGPHVRGIAAPGFRRFIEADGVFRIERIAGTNFYPLPPAFSRIVSSLFPRLAVSLFFLLRKAEPTKRFDPLATRFFETNFLRRGA
jgi:SAM-dependent methyltransferase